MDNNNSFFVEFESFSQNIVEFDLPSNVLKTHPEISWNAQQIGWLIKTGHIRGMKNQHVSLVYVPDVLDEWQRVANKKQAG